MSRIKELVIKNKEKELSEIEIIYETLDGLHEIKKV